MDAPPDGDGPAGPSPSDGARAAISTSALDKLRRRNPKRSEVVARHLAAYIADNHLEEGTVLPSEREMVGILGVGRTTLREALRILETRGVLTIRSGSGGGPVVRRPHLDDLSRAVSLGLQFQSASLRDVMQARVHLESAIARSAATRITDERVRELEAINSHMASAGQESEDSFTAGDKAFYGVISEACENVVLRIFLAALSSIADGRAAGIRLDPEIRRASVASQVRITEALARRDPDEADGAMRAHLATTFAYWERDFGDVIDRPISWAID